MVRAEHHLVLGSISTAFAAITVPEHIMAGFARLGAALGTAILCSIASNLVTRFMNRKKKP